MKMTKAIFRMVDTPRMFTKHTYNRCLQKRNHVAERRQLQVFHWIVLLIVIDLQPRRIWAVSGCVAARCRCLAARCPRSATSLHMMWNGWPPGHYFSIFFHPMLVFAQCWMFWIRLSLYIFWWFEATRVFVFEWKSHCRTMQNIYIFFDLSI